MKNLPCKEPTKDLSQGELKLFERTRKRSCAKRKRTAMAVEHEKLWTRFSCVGRETKNEMVEKKHIEKQM